MADQTEKWVSTTPTARAARAPAPWVVVFALALSGCVSTTTNESQLPTQPLITRDEDNHPTKSKPGPVINKTTAEEIGDATDPCPTQLQNMIGALHSYQSLHRELPERLEDLLPLARPDEPFTVTCPGSGQPYVYLRQGLLHPSGNLRLIVYDATPSHLLTVKGADGHPTRAPVRWGIITTVSGGSAAVVMDVVHLTNAQFRSYAPGAMEIITPPASGAPVPIGGN